ncbi:hypothetical protein D3C87_1693220 [compost metagenome]
MDALDNLRAGIDNFHMPIVDIDLIKELLHKARDQDLLVVDELHSRNGLQRLWQFNFCRMKLSTGDINQDQLVVSVVGCSKDFSSWI